MDNFDDLFNPYKKKIREAFTESGILFHEDIIREIDDYIQHNTAAYLSNNDVLKYGLYAYQKHSIEVNQEELKNTLSYIAGCFTWDELEDKGLIIQNFLIDNPNKNRSNITTGYNFLDSRIGGGLNRQQLSLLIGESGSGKTAVSKYISANALLNGHKVLHLTFKHDDYMEMYMAISDKYSREYNDFFVGEEMNQNIFFTRFNFDPSNYQLLQSELLQIYKSFEYDLIIIDLEDIQNLVGYQRSFQDDFVKTIYNVCLETKSAVFMSVGSYKGSQGYHSILRYFHLGLYLKKSDIPALPDYNNCTYKTFSIVKNRNYMNEDDMYVKHDILFDYKNLIIENQ